MISYLAKRLLLTLPVMFGVSTFTFLLIHFVPGDPVDTMLGPTASDMDKSRIRHELGLDKPLDAQYALFMTNLSHFDLGQSLTTQNSVIEEILKRVPATVELTLAAMFFALLIGVPLGVFAAAKQSSFTDNAILVGGLLGMSIPGFWLGPMLILVFSIKLDLLPVSERGGIEHVILPALSLGLAFSAILMRMTRASMLDVIKEDYVRTARAKGLSNKIVLFKHALRNALMPIITIIGLQLGALLTGTVITETIFDWPGIGTLFYQAIQQRNYPLVQGCVLFISTTYVLTNLLTDFAYALANPRVRLN